MKSLAWLAGMLARGFSGLARRFARLEGGGVPCGLAGFAGGLARFDEELTGYAGLARFAP